MTTRGTSRTGRRRWPRAAAFALTVLAAVWGFVVIGAGSALAMGDGTSGDGSPGVSISLIPPTSSAIQDPGQGPGGDPGGVAPSTAESIWVSLIPPTSSAIDGDASSSARSAGGAVESTPSGTPRVEVKADSRGPSAQSTVHSVAPTASASSAPPAGAGAGSDNGSSLPGVVSASGFGPLGSWLIGIGAAVLVGAAVAFAVTRRRLRER